MLLAPMTNMPDIEPSAPLKIGIEFVAMKRNIHELPAIQEIADKIRASFILVTNVLPYTAEMQDEILYNLEPTSYEGQGWSGNPLWILPKMDWSRETQEPLSTIMRRQANLSYLDINLNQRNNYCPFVRTGSLAVAWHGGVSPCPPLLHSYTCLPQGLGRSFSAAANTVVCRNNPCGRSGRTRSMRPFGSGCANSNFRPARIAAAVTTRRRTRWIASATLSPSAATASGRAAFCAAHKKSRRAFEGNDFGRAAACRENRSEAEIRNGHLKNKTKYGESYNENE